MNTPEVARQNMIAGQLKPNRVTQDQLITAFSYVSREDFAPPAQEHLAYSDAHVPLGGGRVLLASLPLAQLIQMAALKPSDRVLVVGCATGYSLAILAQMVSSIVAVESDPGLYAAMVDNCTRFGLTQVTQVQAPLVVGHPQGAPYDVIMIEGCVAGVPNSLTNQLAEGGRLITLLKTSGTGLSQGIRITRNGDVLTQLGFFDAQAPYLPEFTPTQGFIL